MQLKDLIAAYRSRADDNVEPYSASDPDVTGWLNEAVDEAAVRAKLIHDSTSSVCSVPVAQGQATVRIASEIFEIASARLAARDQTLEGIDQSVLDDTARVQSASTQYRYQPHYRYAWFSNGRWRERVGTPRFFMQDGRSLRLVPIPTEDDTLNLGVYRIPLPSESLRSPGDEPYLNATHHRRLVAWAIYRAFMRRDEEQLDEKVAGEALAEFIDSFGERPDANVMRKRAERSRRTTTINWP